MNFATIRLEYSGEVAVLVLNQPDKRNGLSLALQREMQEAIRAVQADGRARALLLTGEGRSFCAGGALDELESKSEDGSSIGTRTSRMMEELSNPLFLALQQLPMPTVCAMNGSAAGAGISLALSTDIVVAAESSFFVAPFLPRLGLVPDMGATWFLPHSIGRARSLGAMLLGDRIDARKAVDWGLIWACVPDAELRTAAMGIAERLARAPAHAALEARRAVDAALMQGLPAQLKYETDRQRELLDLPSFSEGVRAFMEKREPQFRK
jgi:2-(1,2-epoxy-1,2-dihydrophenyl)acetyl-CoA isomerase